jgi:hypothetical protein
MTLIWLDGAVQGDTLPDVWFSYRRISDENWSTPMNLTETPGFPELLLHAAPTLKSNGSNNYTMFIGRCYESGVTSYPPESGNRTVFYAGQYTFDANPTSAGEGGALPESFGLSQNYPNPFNPTTTIDYTVPRGTNVRLVVYNALGQKVATLVDGHRNAGSYAAEFSAAKVASGVYFYTLTAGEFTSTKKMVLMK